MSKKIEFNCYDERKDDMREVNGSQLAELLSLDPSQYLSLELPNMTFIPECIPVISFNVIRPERIFLDENTIEIPNNLEIRTGALCNSGDILVRNKCGEDYFLYLGKSGKENLAIILKEYPNGSYHSELFEGYDHFERIFASKKLNNWTCDDKKFIFLNYSIRY